VRVETDLLLVAHAEVSEWGIEAVKYCRVGIGGIGGSGSVCSDETRHVPSPKHRIGGGASKIIFSPDASTADRTHSFPQQQCRSEVIREVVAGSEVVTEDEDRLVEGVEVN
jgi:hypothetical protein